MVKLTIKTGVDGLELSFDPGEDREARKEFMQLLGAVVSAFAVIAGAEADPGFMPSDDR